MEVERLSSDRLTRQIWRFGVRSSIAKDKVSIVLELYAIEKRETTRHKFKSLPASRWDAFDQRAYYSGIKAADVPLPEDVQAEAIAKLEIKVYGADIDRRYAL